MTENFGWVAEFVLRLQSITLLVRVTRLPQLVKNALDKDNKTTKLKRPVFSMMENTGLFLGRKQNGRKVSWKTFPFEKTYYATYIFL